MTLHTPIDKKGRDDIRRLIILASTFRHMEETETQASRDIQKEIKGLKERLQLKEKKSSKTSTKFLALETMK